MRATTGRDDFFTQIHKAIRWGLFDVAGRLGRIDADDPGAVAEVAASWQRLAGMLRAHTTHEETFIYPLCEAKAPGSTHLRHGEHDELDTMVDALDAAITTLADPGTTPAVGAVLDVGRDLSRFIGAYLPHLLEEELTAMPLLWATCDDTELAACRDAFMACVGPEENLFTLELMFAALDPAELTAVVEGCRTAGGHVWDQLIDVATRVGTLDQRQLLGLDQT